MRKERKVSAMPDTHGGGYTAHVAQSGDPAARIPLLREPGRLRPAHSSCRCCCCDSLEPAANFIPLSSSFMPSTLSSARIYSSWPFLGSTLTSIRGCALSRVGADSRMNSGLDNSCLPLPCFPYFFSLSLFLFSRLFQVICRWNGRQSDQCWCREYFQFCCCLSLIIVIIINISKRCSMNFKLLEL